ncbi:nucleotidyltransferase family protein [Litchfieldia salsa]|uniref:Molybdenum cofactor cytidylyltransferase n=1 Tax=Litchfieldia salsa TaxID=930152 RepID=A0A1H0TDH0_9BACI|nr:nucleotidyltransferase family protein [Litchfieldia salsa]SDP51668.1 molybdenum cofactor cytidylyltransferase [Litchfieldia salsa]
MREGGVVGIYLAAGKSSRMGTHKLSLPFGNISLGSFALQTILSSPLKSTIIVTKTEDKLNWISPSFLSEELAFKWKIISSPNSNLGQSESLKAGLTQASFLNAQAVIIFLADQPFVSSIMIQKLFCEYKEIISVKVLEKKTDFIAASINGIIKPPIIFLSHSFPKLFTLTGDQGARSLINNGQLKGKIISFNDEKLFLDVDTEHDYNFALSNLTVKN